MDFEELMRVVYAGISSVQDGKVGEVQIDRAFDEEDGISVTICSRVRPLFNATATITRDDDPLEDQER